MHARAIAAGYQVERSLPSRGRSVVLRRVLRAAGIALTVAVMHTIRYFIEWASWFVVRQEPDLSRTERIAGPFNTEAEAIAELDRLAASE